MSTSRTSEFKNSFAYKIYRRFRGGPVSPMERVRFHQSHNPSWFEFGLRRLLRPLTETERRYNAMSPAMRAACAAFFIATGYLPYEIQKIRNTGVSSVELMRRHYELRYGEEDAEGHLRRRRERMDKLFEF